MNRDDSSQKRKLTFQLEEKWSTRKKIKNLGKFNLIAKSDGNRKKLVKVKNIFLTFNSEITKEKYDFLSILIEQHFSSKIYNNFKFDFSMRYLDIKN